MAIEVSMRLAAQRLGTMSCDDHNTSDGGAPHSHRLADAQHSVTLACLIPSGSRSITLPPAHRAVHAGPPPLPSLSPSAALLCTVRNFSRPLAPRVLRTATIFDVTTCTRLVTVAHRQPRSIHATTSVSPPSTIDRDGRNAAGGVCVTDSVIGERSVSQLESRVAFSDFHRYQPT